MKGGARSKYDVAHYVGTRFGSRVVVSRAANHKGYQRWHMRCDCGALNEVDVTTLMKGRALQCANCQRTKQSGAASPSWRGYGLITGTAFSCFRKSALARSIEWSITIEQLDALFEQQNGRCALSGATLTMKRGNRIESNCSLDRRDSRRGYTIDNVQFTTVDVNMAKQALSEADFISMCRMVAQHADHRGSHELEKFQDAA